MYTLKARTATTSCERHVDVVPEDFNPDENPILAVHYFGIPHHRGAEVFDYRRLRLARALHGLGAANGIEVGTRADVARRLEASA